MAQKMARQKAVEVEMSWGLLLQRTWFSPSSHFGVGRLLCDKSQGLQCPRDLTRQSFRRFRIAYNPGVNDEMRVCRHLNPAGQLITFGLPVIRPASSISHRRPGGDACGFSLALTRISLSGNIAIWR
jgi:hypothetical protein